MSISVRYLLLLFLCLAGCELSETAETVESPEATFQQGTEQNPHLVPFEVADTVLTYPEKLLVPRPNFGQITLGHSVSDTSAVFVDEGYHKVYLITESGDLQIQEFGDGQGPGEWTRILSLAVSGDGTARLFDSNQLRFSEVGTDGGVFDYRGEISTSVLSPDASCGDGDLTWGARGMDRGDGVLFALNTDGAVVRQGLEATGMNPRQDLSMRQWVMDCSDGFALLANVFEEYLWLVDLSSLKIVARYAVPGAAPVNVWNDVERGGIRFDYGRYYNTPVGVHRMAEGWLISMWAGSTDTFTGLLLTDEGVFVDVPQVAGRVMAAAGRTLFIYRENPYPTLFTQGFR